MVKTLGKTGNTNRKHVKQDRITKQQVHILQLVYRFRFVSTKHVQQLLGRKQIQQAQQRLNLLLQKQYIGRNFSTLDRLTGHYASYYLLPKGMKALKQNEDKLDRKLEQQVLHNIYNDKTASPRFIKHQLDLGDVLLELELIHGHIIHYLTKSGLTIYNYLPEQLPDAFVFIQDKTKEESGRTNYFLEYWEDNVPFWVYRNRIKQYIDYEYEATWEDAARTTMPAVLLVAETSVLQRRILRFLKRQLPDSYTDAKFLVTNKEALAEAKSEDAIWVGFNDDDDERVELSL